MKAIKQVSIRLCNGQLKNAQANPPTVVPAQGPRSVIHLIGYMVHYQDDATEPLAFPNGMGFGITASSGQFSEQMDILASNGSPLEPGGLITTNGGDNANQDRDNLASGCANNPLQFLSGGDITGDGYLDVIVNYYVAQFLL